ncbi:MAG TPA: hypothetical protein GYA08_15365 [Chloroflexi bacterium]|nr:hypothetical protein [Chloroflexota bacterium]
MMLAGSQIAQLLDALLAAYPRRDDLRMMVRVELNENLDAIAGGDTLRAVAFSLIEWAQRTGRTAELIAGARRGNPGNPALRAFAETLALTLGGPSPNPPPAAPSPDTLASANPPASLTVTIRPRMEQVYTALADLFDPDARPLVEVELRNATAQPRRILVSSHIQEYSHVAETTVTLAPGAVETVRQLPALRKPAVQAITELTKAELSVSVRDLDADQIVQQQSFRSALLARNAAPIAARDPHTNAWIDMTPYLAAFVTPNAPAVMETLRRAVERHPEQRLAGYQADVGLQVNALYDVLRHDIALAYVQSIISFNPDAAALDQRVRLPAETLRQRSANCLDAALLVASLLEACSLNPALLLSRDHAIVGWETQPGRGEWAWLETTVFLTNDYPEALNLGKRKAAFFHQRRKQTGDAIWHRLLPIKVLRTQHHITPLE